MNISDLQIVLLILVLSLLIVQILALIRMRMVFKYLQRLIQIFSLKKKEQKPAKTKCCGNCHFRQTFINASATDEKEGFYYQCKLSRKGIKLNSICEHYIAEQP